jgi:hypothetical protein
VVPVVAAPVAAVEPIVFSSALSLLLQSAKAGLAIIVRAITAAE